MNLADVEVKAEYRSLLHNVTQEFYIPLLSQAVEYNRAVGFFSSTVLSQIADGVVALAKNGGKIKIVASPHLSDEDIAAIRKGYELRDIVKTAVLRELIEATDLFTAKRLNLLAHLIADEILDIKIAFTENGSQMGMYHEKLGIISDSDGNSVAFSGSMNESENALTANYEVIDVWCSWKGNEQSERVTAKLAAFSSIWSDCEPNIKIVDFPELKQEIIDRYRLVEITSYNQISDDEFSPLAANTAWFRRPTHYPAYYDYQLEAIQSWKDNGYHGIFDMATGTGKTITALGALEMLSSEVDGNMGVIIVCPYQHLIEQWVDDIKSYGVTPLICYSAYDWKKKFKYALEDYSCGAARNFCVITTNDTLASKYFQTEIDKVKGNVCLVVDEAHNFGAKRQLACMKEIYTHRLALSATLERKYDEIGTNRLLEFFGGKCTEYSLERAIKEDKLTPYYYYPIPIELESDELDEYNELTEKIVKIMRMVQKGAKLPQSAEMLLIKRARIIAAARKKLKSLYEIIRDKYVYDDHILVYCGAATLENSSYKEGEIEPEERRQIDIVVDMLGNDLGMRVSKFTSAENSKEREQIKVDFSDGDMLKVLVAIRCLDEGMNIPGIKTAFILASSTNPKEYIQRRGRVLRKAKGKRFAVIYDFIALPRSLESPLPDDANINSEFSLIRREYERMEDFARLAENSSEVVKLQDKIREYYGLNFKGGHDYGI